MVNKYFAFTRNCNMLYNYTQLTRKIDWATALEGISVGFKSCTVTGLWPPN